MNKLKIIHKKNENFRKKGQNVYINKILKWHITGLESDVYINQIFYPVRTLGFGSRVGLWFQGCSIHCKGCISEHTRAFDEKFLMNLNYVFYKLKELKKFNPDGITISGGEPFDQPNALSKILKFVRKLKYKEILVYSGYNYGYLKNNYKDILKNIDILISGPFMVNLSGSKIWRGSDNQEIIILSKKTKNKYKDINLNDMLYSENRNIQIEVFNDRILIIGIPKRGDLEKIILNLEEYEKRESVFSL